MDTLLDMVLLSRWEEKQQKWNHQRILQMLILFETLPPLSLPSHPYPVLHGNSRIEAWTTTIPPGVQVSPGLTPLVGTAELWPHSFSTVLLSLWSEQSVDRSQLQGQSSPPQALPRRLSLPQCLVFKAISSTKLAASVYRCPNTQNWPTSEQDESHLVPYITPLCRRQLCGSHSDTSNTTNAFKPTFHLFLFKAVFI